MSEKIIEAIRAAGPSGTSREHAENIAAVLRDRVLTKDYMLLLYENERLSASNAELLRAAKRALPVIADLMPFNPDTDDPSDRLAYDALEAAIAKHEGTE